MRTSIGSFAVMAIEAASCGGPTGPSVLHGPLAFPVVTVNASTSSLIAQGAPDGGWEAVELDISGSCGFTDGFWQPAGTVMVDLEIWNRDGGAVVAGTWPLVDPGADPNSGSASLYYRDAPDGPQDSSAGTWLGVGGSVTLSEAGPVYVGSFATTVNGQGLSGTFSTAGPDRCACTQLPGGEESCPQL